MILLKGNKFTLVVKKSLKPCDVLIKKCFLSKIFSSEISIFIQNKYFSYK